MKDPRDVIIAPVVSEKSYSSLDAGIYTFVVNPKATKTEIKDAVQRIFDVRVLRVNTMVRKGKRKRNRNFTFGNRASVKRALVTLAEGDSIEIFNPK